MFNFIRNFFKKDNIVLKEVKKIEEEDELSKLMKKLHVKYRYLADLDGGFIGSSYYGIVRNNIVFLRHIISSNMIDIKIPKEPSNDPNDWIYDNTGILYPRHKSGMSIVRTCFSDSTFFSLDGNSGPWDDLIKETLEEIFKEIEIKEEEEKIKKINEKLILEKENEEFKNRWSEYMKKREDIK